MSIPNIYKNLRAWVRLDGFGIMIPGSVQFRKNMPKQGRWAELKLNYCCDSTADSYIIIQNNTTNGANPGAVVTSLVSGDNKINFSGSIAQSGGMMVFAIPFSLDETFTLTIDGTLTDGVDVSSSTFQGTGVISSPSPSLLTGSTKTTTFTTTAVPGSQYLVTLVDD